MKSISISRAKTFAACKLLYNYKYVNKFAPAEANTPAVTVKGLVLHETFESLLKYENYEDDVPKLPYRQASEDVVKSTFKEMQTNNKLTDAQVEEFHLEIGVKRWLDFKHRYLDKNGHIMYAEKEYNEKLFGETTTITILDLLEDCGDGNFIIYDYKTPKSVDVNRYKEQLVLYAYTMACVKGIIEPGSEEFEKVANHFKLYVFFPLVWDNNKAPEEQPLDYESCLKAVSFTAKDVENVIKHLKDTCDEIDAFDFSRPAEVLQPSKLSFQCSWCEYCGAAPQKELISANGRPFEGCPITHFCGKPALNEKFIAVQPYEKKVEETTN